MKNHYILEYNDIFINNQLRINNSNPNSWQTLKVSSTNSLSQNGLKFLLQSGLVPSFNFNLFIGPPNFDTTIHVDNLSQCYAINYIWGESKSKMRWFELKDNESPVSSRTTAGTSYMTYNNHQVNLVEEIEVPNNTLILVRIDIPHQVSNYSNNRRYCLSVRGSPVMKWEDAVRHFSPHFQKEAQI
jgi:hypothetical protein